MSGQLRQNGEDRDVLEAPVGLAEIEQAVRDTVAVSPQDCRRSFDVSPVQMRDLRLVGSF